MFVVPVAASKKKTKSAEAETWKARKKDAKNNVSMPPLRERRGGDTEAEEEGEEEELGSAGSM